MNTLRTAIIFWVQEGFWVTLITNESFIKILHKYPKNKLRKSAAFLCTDLKNRPSAINPARYIISSCTQTEHFHFGLVRVMIGNSIKDYFLVLFLTKHLPTISFTLSDRNMGS